PRVLRVLPARRDLPVRGDKPEPPRLRRARRCVRRRPSRQRPSPLRRLRPRRRLPTSDAYSAATL
ncbi:MAG TPA: hypothetical protein VF744_01545, partial [Beijerinckiaceae bacterium]